MPIPNIIQVVCKKQKMTYKQLANSIGVSESTLRSSVCKNKISKQVKKSIEMYLRIVNLEKELAEANTIKHALKSWLDKKYYNEDGMNEYLL